MTNFYIEGESYDTDKIISIELLLSTSSIKVVMKEDRRHYICMQLSPEESAIKYSEIMERYNNAVENRKNGLEDEAMRERYKEEAMLSIGIDLRKYKNPAPIDNSVVQDDDKTPAPPLNDSESFIQGSLF